MYVTIYGGGSDVDVAQGFVEYHVGSVHAASVGRRHDGPG